MKQLYKQRDAVWLKGNHKQPGIIAAVQHNPQEETIYHVLWRDCTKSSHTREQLEERK